MNLSDGDDDAKFILKTLLHPRERLKRLSKNYLIRNQIDKKKFPQILPQKKLIQKNKNQSKDIEYIKKVPLHRCEHLKCKKRIKQELEIQYVKTVPQHPRDRLSRRLKNKPANIICDEKFLKEFPYFNRKIKVNKTDKIKDERQLYIKLLNRYHLTMINGMLNTIEILIQFTLERKTKNKLLS